MQQANIINIITNKYEPQQKHRLGTVSKKKNTGGLKPVLQAPNLALSFYHGSKHTVVRSALFWFIAYSLGLGSLDDLLELDASFEETPRHFRFSAEELVFLKEYDMRAGLEPLADDHFSQFPPSRIKVLSNYLLLSRLFIEIGTAAQGALTSGCRYTNLDGSSPPLGHPVLEMGITDSLSKWTE